MLAEFLQTKTVKPGEQIFCYVPESGRFMAAYMLLEVEEEGEVQSAATARQSVDTAKPVTTVTEADIAPPHDPAHAPVALRDLLTELAAIWHDYRSQVWRTPLVRTIRERRFTQPDYLHWMEHWVPQVREGSLWMREGAASLTGDYAALAALIGVHAGEEQNDFQILFDDYRKAGGMVADIAALRRNPGGEALNAYLHGLAATRDPIGLLGAIYIIEGTGQRIVPALLPLLRAALQLPPDVFRFLEYHGHNDENHLACWLTAVEMVMAFDTDGRAAQQILGTARHTAALYLMQFQHVTAA
jgi:3-oxoacyl-[acyl-carrier-protein] synthase-3